MQHAIHSNASVNGGNRRVIASDQPLLRGSEAIFLPSKRLLRPPRYRWAGSQ